MRVVLADLKGKTGFVNKDTIVGGFGSRFQGFSWTTNWVERVRKAYQNVPSVHTAYLAAIFEQAGHEVVFTDGPTVPGDLGLVLTSIVDHRQETQWADEARQKYGMKVGFFGAMATHFNEVLKGHGDFIIKGEPEEAAMRLAKGETFSGEMPSRALDDLDALPFPAWHLTARKRAIHAVGRSFLPTRSAFPILSSRSCPEFCTYCPHRITAPYRSRTPDNVLAEIDQLCSKHGKVYLIFRDPLFSEERERAVAIAEGLIRNKMPVHFECETRLDSLDVDLLNLLYKAGMRAMTFGVESVESTTLKHVARRPIPPAHQRAMVEHCRTKGITTHAFFVFGFLDDTAESIRATIDYAIDLGPQVALFKILTPYPGTPLYKQVAKLITETDLEKFDGYTLNFKHPHLTEKEIKFLLAAAYARFYVRLSWAWGFLGIGNGCSDLISRVDAYAREQQIRNEVTFFASQEPKTRT